MSIVIYVRRMSSKTQKSIDICIIIHTCTVKALTHRIGSIAEQFPQILKLTDSLCDLDVEIVDSINNSLSLDNTRSDVKPYDLINSGYHRFCV